MEVKTIKLITGDIVSAQDYIDAKTKDLRDFGYSNLTTEEVGIQLEKVINGLDDLTVIGMFIADDLASSETQPNE
ncbi:MAG: hypothetical protein WC333_02280 [Dehalococcoidia bacterium]|jgi:hypothetical protein